MTSRSFLLGIDLGTTTCRAVIFDFDGAVVAAAYKETRVSYPRPLWAEVDPEDWWRDTCAVVRDALARTGVPSTQIAAVGLSGLMHAPVLLDDEGKPVAPAQLWMDQRCAAQSEALHRDATSATATGRVSTGTGVSAPKIRWLAEQQPDVLKRARHFLLPKDFVRFRLTGRYLTDASDAGGTGMYDRASAKWNDEIVDWVGLSRDVLPTISQASVFGGRVTAEAARQTGLPEGAPVAVGGADTLCTRLGVGPMEPDEVCIYLGTAAWVSVTQGRGGDGQPILRGFGATSTTGAALRWARDLLGFAGGAGADDYRRLDHMADEIPLGAEGLFFLPHLMGERGPHPDPLARGALIGLTLRHGRSHLVRSILEGTAFQLRRVIEARLLANPDFGRELSGGVVCGGGARSALWVQILSDVTGLTLRIPAVFEAAALGAAMLGATAAGLGSLDEASARMIHYYSPRQPCRESSARYDGLFKRYCQLDDLLTPFFHEADLSVTG